MIQVASEAIGLGVAAETFGSKYFGQAKKDINNDELLRDLQKYDIDYFFYWSQFDDATKSLLLYKEITKRSIPGLRIFSLRGKNIP